jgi:hypothetical protein
MKLNLLKTFERQRHSYGAFLMNNEAGEQVSQYLKSFYISFGLKPQLDQNWFRWFSTENPLGHCNNYILIDLEKDQWIGGIGFAKKSYLSGGSRLLGGLLVNGFMNSGYEGLGLYTELMSTGMTAENSIENGAFGFTYARKIAPMNALQKNGFRPSISLTFMEIELNPRNTDDDEVVCTNNATNLRTIDLKMMEALTEVSFTRSLPELLWRYSDRPDKTYTYLTMTAGDDVGYMILGSYFPADGNKRCEIADFLYSSPHALNRLIDKARFVAADANYHFLDVLINPHSKCQAHFRHKGFRDRGDGYELLTYLKKPIVAPTNMTVTYGDFDVV